MNHMPEMYPHGYMSPPDSTSSRDSTYEYPPSSNYNPYNRYPQGNRYGNKAPILKIVEQPVDIFRFRYMTEMSGTHGCLLGENYKKSKKKTHPGVELCNYTGKALIRCSLVQVHEKTEEHPHRLLVDDKEMDAVREVDFDRGYTVVFSGIGIIHTAKRDVAAELMKRKQQQTAITNTNDYEKLKLHCEKQAKNIDLNAVCLRFSAHTVDTDEWICEPVFSNPIYNLKSAMTNELKIVRIDKIQGSAEGREDVFILVEKVTKKNIKVRFFELDDKKVEVWSAKGSFSHSDVHHQYAIVFRTPPYRQTNLTKDVLVHIQLVRPSDGKCSEPVDFTYLANRRFKRKASDRSPYSSIGSGSLNSTDLPLTVTSPLSGVSTVSPNPGYELADAMLHDDSTVANEFINPLLINQPPLFPGITGNDIMFSSAEINKSEIIDQLMHEKADSAELRKFIENHSDSYIDVYMADAPATDSASKKNGGKSNLVVDGVKKVEGQRNTTAKLRASRPFAQQSSSTQVDYIKEEGAKNSSDDAQVEDRGMAYLATFNEKDSLLIKKLLQEICSILTPQNKNPPINKELLRQKFTKLMDVRLSNGDTFLHMAIGNKLLPYFEFLVKVMSKMQFIDLLNIQNDEDETLLHTAVLYDHKQLIPLLISSGCDKNIKDCNGNTALHLAVTNRRLGCLQELLKQLERIPTNEHTMHIHMKNNDGNTAFHIANNIGCTASVVALIKAGADMYALNSTQRLPLTLAVYGNHVNVINALIQHKINVDAPDGRGYTALQIACGMNAEYAYNIARILLEAGAKPLRKSFSGETALNMAEGDPQMIKLLYEYIDDIDIAIKDEPAEEMFESADDMSLSDAEDDVVASYVCKIAPLLDSSGNWRELAKRLNQNAMLECIEESKSPTMSIFTLLSACEKTYTDDFLIKILTDMGETQAADIVRSFV